MTEPTPPPERPLPDQARSRIRRELLEHAHRNRSVAVRWLPPAGAAAAVALVAGLGYWAINTGGDDTSERTPVGGGGSSAPTASSSAWTGPSPTTDVSETATTTKPDDTKTVQVGTRACDAELEYVLKGAESTVDADEVSFWTKGDRFSLCYEIDGSTTVTHPLPLTPQQRVETYRVISLYPPTDDGYRTVRVAGGVVPHGAEDFDVAYTFPDGHTEHGTTVTDASGRTWWRMVYSYDDGGGNEMNKPEISVTASYGGFSYSFDLEWGVDTCAQANHGC